MDAYVMQSGGIKRLTELHAAEGTVGDEIADLLIGA